GAVHIFRFGRPEFDVSDQGSWYRRIDDAFFQPGIAASEYTLGCLGLGGVAVVPQRCEQFLRAQPGLGAEQVGEVVRGRAALGPRTVGPVHLSPDARGADREEL